MDQTMKVDIKGVHFDVPELTKEFIQVKLARDEFAGGMIVDIAFTLTKTKNDYITEAKVNFRWGVSAHLTAEAFDLHEALDKLMDKVDMKIRKEKGKIQDHSATKPDAETV